MIVGGPIEASKLLRKMGAKRILCICVHAILVNDALKKFRKAKIELVSCNTIPNRRCSDWEKLLTLKNKKGRCIAAPAL